MSAHEGQSMVCCAWVTTVSWLMLIIYSMLLEPQALYHGVFGPNKPRFTPATLEELLRSS
jgi:hypothetical protein